RLAPQRTAGIRREIAKAGEPELPFGNIDAGHEGLILEQVRVTLSCAGAQITVERGLRDETRASLEETAKCSPVMHRLFLPLQTEILLERAEQLTGIAQCKQQAAATRRLAGQNRLGNLFAHRNTLSCPKMRSIIGRE